MKLIARGLRSKGYRITPQRKAIINLLQKSIEHLTPGDIYERLKRSYPSIGLVTVYRTLDLLGKNDLLCEIHIEQGCRSYHNKRREGHHHHLICSRCGKVVDFATCDLEKLQDKLSRETGFIIEKHLLEFSGCCQKCQEKIEHEREA